MSLYTPKENENPTMQNLDWYKNWENIETKQGPVGESGVGGWMMERIYEWIEWIDEWLNGWMDRFMNWWIDDLINEWVDSR